eukprot:8506043-Ditylum_brightwellii.AAC.1
MQVFSCIEKKANRKTAGHSQIFNYFDDLLHGSAPAKETFPASFYYKMDFCKFQNKTSTAKESGDTDEPEADCIPTDLCRLICR